MKSRAPKLIFIDYSEKVVLKSSSNHQKIKAEINYYSSLPKNLSGLFPKLYAHQNDYSSYTLEYIPSPNLAKFLQADSSNLTLGKDILHKLMGVLNTLHSEKMTFANPDQIAQFYIGKTLDRIYDLKKNIEFDQLLNRPYLNINGKFYKNFYLLKSEFINRISKFSKENNTCGVIHGNFALSNILYNSDKKEFKLIDPRGSFFDIGHSGHTYYDYAKLMQCLHGRYDFITSDQFFFHENLKGDYIFDCSSSVLFDQLHEIYVSILAQKKMNVEFLYLIEASLFLSAAALHYENPDRQKLLYLTGIIILNNLFDQ